MSKITYIFVDEAGNMDFSQQGTKYYMFCFLVKHRPFTLHRYISDFRYDLLERNIHIKAKPIDIEAFHATEDNKFIRKKMFEIISSIEEEKMKIYAYILEKRKIIPDKRKNKDEFYINNLHYAIGKLLSIINQKNDFIVITDRLPVKKSKLIKGLKTGIADFIKGKDIKYEIFHHCSASSVYLQVIDYINWAIFRKYERDDSEYYEKIKKYIIKEEVLTKGRDKKYY